MSLNIVDLLLDKLFFPSKGKESPSIKKYTGTQSFLSAKSNLYQSITSEFHQALIESECFTPTHHAMNRSSIDSKMNLLHHFEPFNSSLVSRVSKLFFPSISTFHDCIRAFPNHSKMNQDPDYYLHPSFNILCEEIEQHALMLTKFSSFHSESDKKEMSSLPPEFSSVESTCKKTSMPQSQAATVPISKVDTLQENKQQLVDNNHILNQESSDLKTKGLQINRDREYCLNPCFNIVCEEVERHPLMLTFPSESSKEMPCHPSEFSIIENPCSKTSMPKNQTAAVPLAKVDTLQESKKHLVHNNCILNQELSNRKKKELQKRSKKRRRRQKKNKHMDVIKKCAADAVDTPLKAEGKVKDSTSRLNRSRIVSESSESRKRDILCDFVTIAENVNSVQILLPTLSSFVISVESAGEDDSEWDNSDCEWLTDCSEFEFTGLFVSNLSAPRTSNMCNSKQSAPPSCEEDLEMHRLQTVLRKINKNWNEATKGLDVKPKLTTKVSFAPDAELVEVFPVEVYERKGEWEIYATERIRFRKRIGELENILSPCLSRQHREKVFQRLHQPDL